MSRRSLLNDWNHYKLKANTAIEVPYFLEQIYNPAVYTG